MPWLRLPFVPRAALVAGAALLAIDLGLVALYLGWKLDLVGGAFDLGRDRGAAELVQYAKLLGVGLCAGWLFRRTRQPVFAAFAALFLGLLVDDAGMLHERAGAWAGGALGLPSGFGLQPHDLGELAFVAAWVGPVFAAGVVAYRRSDAGARALARTALGAIGALAAFGVGADLLHQVLSNRLDVFGLNSVLTVVEEGGELAVMSVLAAGAVAVVVRGVGPAANARADASAAQTTLVHGTDGAAFVVRSGDRASSAPAAGDGAAGYTPGVPTSWPPSITNRPPVTNADASDAR